MNKSKFSILFYILFLKIVFSFEVFSNGEELKLFLENKFKISKEIKIVTYSIDDTITKRLINKNHFILADPSGIKTTKNLNIKTISVPNNGIQHEKFFIFDNSTIVFGTGNMTKSGIIGDKNIYIYTEDEKIVQIFKKEFYNLSTQKTKKPLYKKINKTEIGEFLFSSTPNSDIYKIIQKEMSKAKSKIDIFAFSLTDPYIVYEIEKAASRGIEINLYFDDWNIYYSDAIKYLTGIKKISYDDLHAKIVIIDDEIVILGSYNFTYKARNKNYELLTIMKNKTISEIIKSKLVEEDEK